MSSWAVVHETRVVIGKVEAQPLLAASIAITGLQ